jgi:Cyclopropane fatty acid synthase and related methyltransferases
MDQSVQTYYNEHVTQEWQRLEKCFVEYYIVCKYLNKYIEQKSLILDLGGGPGRYALYLAKEKQSSVLLVDLAEQNVTYALHEAQKQDLNIRATVGDCRYIKSITSEKYDSILLLGPIYHLTKKNDRTDSIKQCISLLKPGGTIFIGFISTFSRIIYSLREQAGEILTNDLLRSDIQKSIYRKNVYRKGPPKFMIHPSKIMDFMKPFPEISTLDIVGCEGILGPFLNQSNALQSDIMDKWLDYSFLISNHKEILSYSEHLMYIGRKK